MSDDLSKVPRRLRRFYRNGQPLPENAQPSSSPPHESSAHEENEPWMSARPPSSVSSPESARRRERHTRPSDRSASVSATPNPSPGLFGRVLSRVNKPAVTPMDHALGLHGKASFEEKPPRASEEALSQKPAPVSNANTPLPRTARAQQEIQSALNELRSLAQKEGATKNDAKKTNVSLTSFHFTPAGEAPRAPEATESLSATPASTVADSPLSPRERAEQRRMNRGNSPPEAAASNSRGATTTSPSSPASAHIRRKMGQVETSSTLPESARDEVSGGGVSPREKGDDDFKSLFGESKKKDKKKKKGDEDEDFSLDDDAEDDGGELELFEDEK